MKMKWLKDLKKYLKDNEITIAVDPDRIGDSLWLSHSSGQCEHGRYKIGTKTELFENRQEFLFYKQGNILEYHFEDLAIEDFEYSWPAKGVSDIRNYDGLEFGDFFTLCENIIMTDEEIVQVYGEDEEWEGPKPISSEATTVNLVYVGGNSFIKVEDISKKLYKHLKAVAKLYETLTFEITYDKLFNENGD